MSFKDWLEESDPVLDVRNVGDGSNLEHSKRRKLVEDFGSNERSVATLENSADALKSRDMNEETTPSTAFPAHSFTTPQRPPLKVAVKPPLSVGSSSEYDPRSMSAPVTIEHRVVLTSCEFHLNMITHSSRLSRRLLNWAHSSANCIQCSRSSRRRNMHVICAVWREVEIDIDES